MSEEEGRQKDVLEKERSSIGTLAREGLDYLAELIRVVVISLAIILPIRYFLVQPFYVKGASMEPNFYDHEYLIIDEVSYRFRYPARGEIVVFRYPRDPSQFFIKRVVGLPGEKVQVTQGVVRISNTVHPNGVILEELYLEEGTPMGGEYTLSLGQDEYFVLGDNRLSSLDSRQFGAVPRGSIVGRAWLRGWPIDRVTRFLAPTYELDRLGDTN